MTIQEFGYRQIIIGDQLPGGISRQKWHEANIFLKSESNVRMVFGRAQNKKLTDLLECLLSAIDTLWLLDGKLQTMETSQLHTILPDTLLPNWIKSIDPEAKDNEAYRQVDLDDRTLQAIEIDCRYWSTTGRATDEEKKVSSYILQCISEIRKYSDENITIRDANETAWLAKWN
jgi:hypothetical protein